MMRQASHVIEISCPGRGLYDITRKTEKWVSETGIQQGILHLFIQHTSCSLLIQENADPEVQRDLERFFSRLIRDGDPMFRHRAEGVDDMPAHVRSALTATSLAIPVYQGRLALGIWQGVYVYEHRIHPMHRRIFLHLLGE
jgi:secondary thiamine-phosphate synthase enzyme